MHLAAAEHGDRLSGRHKPGGKVATRLRVVLQAVEASADSAGEERPRCTPCAGVTRRGGLADAGDELRAVRRRDASSVVPRGVTGHPGSGPCGSWHSVRPVLKHGPRS